MCPDKPIGPNANKHIELLTTNPANQIDATDVVQTNKTAVAINNRFSPHLDHRNYVQGYLELSCNTYPGDKVVFIPDQWSGKVPVELELKRVHFKEFVSDAGSLEETIGDRQGGGWQP
jgi:hypothetical protein